MDELIRMIFAAIISVTLGYLVHLCIRIVSFIKRRRATTGICGKWYAYDWWEDENEVTLQKKQGTIRKGLLSEYRVRFTNENHSMSYKGTASVEANQYLCVKTKADDALVEPKISRFNLPMAEHRELLFGLSLFFDFDKNVSCGAVILSRHELSDEQVKELMEKHFTNYYDARLMVLK